MKHLVVGAGEVGTALVAVLASAHHVVMRDIGPSDETADVLHVAFPWSADFVEQVGKYQAHHGAGLVIVHSTVPVGTCDPHGWVHSPVRGRHPHLVEGLLTSVKPCGGGRAEEAARLFERVRVRTSVHARARETESGKLWELVQFGVQVLVEQQIHEWCFFHDVDPDVVYRQFAQDYNDAYRRLGHEELVRPVLEHVPGPIGGHCVRPMAALLDHPLADWVAQ